MKLLVRLNRHGPSVTSNGNSQSQKPGKHLWQTSLASIHGKHLWQTSLENLPGKQPGRFAMEVRETPRREPRKEANGGARGVADRPLGLPLACWR